MRTRGSARSWRYIKRKQRRQGTYEERAPSVDLLRGRRSLSIRIAVREQRAASNLKARERRREKGGRRFVDEGAASFAETDEKKRKRNRSGRKENSGQHEFFPS